MWVDDVWCETNGRCVIPECDHGDWPEYHTDWMANAIPMEAAKYSRCHRFAAANATRLADVQCTADAFDRTRIVRCEHSGLIYRTDEVSIANAV